KEANEALREGRRRESVRMPDIQRTVLTHAHTDQCGSARSIRGEARDARGRVHDWGTGHRGGRLQPTDNPTQLARAGVPKEEIERMRKLYEMVRMYADSFEDHEYESLEDGAELEFTSGSLRILHTPGHTPGSCSFLREADRTIIAGDCVLK